MGATKSLCVAARVAVRKVDHGGLWAHNGGLGILACTFLFSIDVEHGSGKVRQDLVDKGSGKIKERVASGRSSRDAIVCHIVPRLV